MFLFLQLNAFSKFLKPASRGGCQYWHGTLKRRCFLPAREECKECKKMFAKIIKTFTGIKITLCSFSIFIF
jgi:hypothetical protein